MDAIVAGYDAIENGNGEIGLLVDADLLAGQKAGEPGVVTLVQEDSSVRARVILPDGLKIEIPGLLYAISEKIAENRGVTLLGIVEDRILDGITEVRCVLSL